MSAHQQRLVASDRNVLRLWPAAARLTWHAGKVYDASALELTDGLCEGAAPVDWSADRKQECLLSTWGELLSGLDAAQAEAGAAS